jgi:hypothetical protein
MSVSSLPALNGISIRQSSLVEHFSHYDPESSAAWKESESKSTGRDYSDPDTRQRALARALTLVKDSRADTHPDPSRAHFDAAVLFDQLGLVDKAKLYFRKATERHDPDVVVDRFQVYLYHNFRPAVTAWSSALSLSYLSDLNRTEFSLNVSLQPRLMTMGSGSGSGPL